MESTETIHCGDPIAYCGVRGQQSVPHDRPELATCDRCLEVANAFHEYWRVAYRLAALLAPNSSSRKRDEFVSAAHEMALRWQAEKSGKV